MLEYALNSARELLQGIRQETTAIGVAFSAGKDSYAVLDLCCSVFARTEAYYLYRVADQEVIAEQCRFVQKRYGVIVRHYPHQDLVRCCRHAVLRPHVGDEESIKDVSWQDVEEHFRLEARIKWIAYGWRRNDSFSRAMILSRCRGIDLSTHRAFPCWLFRRAEILAYLNRRCIPVPPNFGRKDQGGMDFHPATVSYLRDHYPRDFARLLADFPFADAPAATAHRTGQAGRERVGRARREY